MKEYSVCRGRTMELGQLENYINRQAQYGWEVHTFLKEDSDWFVVLLEREVKND